MFKTSGAGGSTMRLGIAGLGIALSLVGAAIAAMQMFGSVLPFREWPRPEVLREAAPIVVNDGPAGTSDRPRASAVLSASGASPLAAALPVAPAGAGAILTPSSVAPPLRGGRGLPAPGPRRDGRGDRPPLDGGGPPEAETATPAPPPSPAVPNVVPPPGDVAAVPSPDISDRPGPRPGGDPSLGVGIGASPGSGSGLTSNRPGYPRPPKGGTPRPPKDRNKPSVSRPPASGSGSGSQGSKPAKGGSGASQTGQNPKPSKGKADDQGQKSGNAGGAKPPKAAEAVNGSENEPSHAGGESGPQTGAASAPSQGGKTTQNPAPQPVAPPPPASQGQPPPPQGDPEQDRGEGESD